VQFPVIATELAEAGLFTDGGDGATASSAKHGGYDARVKEFAT